MRSMSLAAAFVFPNPRRELAAQVRSGSAPDTGLLGQNHLAEHGVDAFVVEPGLRRRRREDGLAHRLTWNVREVTLPWEMRRADVAVTPLANLFPLAARVRGKPKVVLLNYGVSTIWRRASPPRRALLAAALRSCAAVACLASSQRDEVLAATGLDAARVQVVPIGADERFFAAAPLPEDGYVLAVGKDLARDYATLARAASGLEARFVLVALPRNLRGVALPPNVEVRSGVSWHELRDLYAGAGCVVLPLRRPDYPYGTEGSGLTALVEAMASGRPVVATDRGVFRDYMMPGESCLTVPPEDPEALRTAVERVLGDRREAERLGRRCRELVEERFTTRHLAARLATLLREVAGA
jgi:glycosyltransferase involved in cell wall biosynthesis